MDSSTTIAWFGSASRISAITRGIEAGVRLQAFSARCFWAATSRSLSALQVGIAHGALRP